MREQHGAMLGSIGTLAACDGERDTAAMPFRGPVVVTPILPKGKRWLLVESFEYEGKTDMFTVPEGFTTDFASVPRVFVWLLPRYGRWTQAAVLHDFLWHLSRQDKFNKADADGIFNRALRELEVPFVRRWIMWTAVRWGSGPRSWFTKGPLPFLKMLAITLPTLALVAIPALVILIALIIGAVAEFVAYFPLRLLHRDKRKPVNAPEAGEIFLS